MTDLVYPLGHEAGSVWTPTLGWTQETRYFDPAFSRCALLSSGADPCYLAHDSVVGESSEAGVWATARVYLEAGAPSVETSAIILQVGGEYPAAAIVQAGAGPTYALRLWAFHDAATYLDQPLPALLNGRQVRLDLHLYSAGGAAVADLSLDTVPTAAVTLPGSANNGVSTLWFGGAANGALAYWSECALANHDTRTYRFPTVAFVAAGAFAEGAGPLSAIAAPGRDGAGCVFTAPGQRNSYVPAGLPAGWEIGAVAFNALAYTDTNTRVHPLTRIDGSNPLGPEWVPGSDGAPCRMIYQTNPVTGEPWSGLLGAEFGVQATALPQWDGGALWDDTITRWRD